MVWDLSDVTALALRNIKIKQQLCSYSYESKIQLNVNRRAEISVIKLKMSWLHWFYLIKYLFNLLFLKDHCKIQ